MALQGLKPALLCLLWLMPTPAHADMFSNKGVSKYGLPKSQLKLLNGRLAVQYENSKRLLPMGHYLPRYTGEYAGEYLKMADDAAALHGIPKDLFARLIQQESNWHQDAISPTNWHQDAISPAGAIGLAQLMPDTARRLGVDPLDPKSNLEGGARYLKQQYARFGSWKLAIAAYNAGPEAVDSYDDVPPYPETVAYVRAILGE